MLTDRTKLKDSEILIVFEFSYQNLLIKKELIFDYLKNSLSGVPLTQNSLKKFLTLNNSQLFLKKIELEQVYSTIYESKLFLELNGATNLLIINKKQLEPIVFLIG